MPSDTSRSSEEAPEQLELFPSVEQRKPKNYGIFLESGKLGVTIGGGKDVAPDVRSDPIPVSSVIPSYPFGPLCGYQDIVE